MIVIIFIPAFDEVYNISPIIFPKKNNNIYNATRITAENVQDVFLSGRPVYTVLAVHQSCFL